MNDVGPNSEPCFVCRTCSWVSYHPNDIINRYCGNCHQFDGWEGDDSGYRQFGEPWAEEAAMDWAEEAAKENRVRDT